VGFLFWAENCWEKLWEEGVWEEKMDVRGTSHDYFDEAARHASGDR
jgi:hypothetical protein